MTVVDMEKVGPDDFTDRVDPVNYKETRGEIYKDEFMFGEVHHEFDPDNVFPDSVLFNRIDDESFIYQYVGKVPVMVTRTEVGTVPAGDVEEAEQQAYFVLSMLESEGYVTGWKKK